MTARTAICVIGAGIGGLALAIRLQSAGVATTIVEARPQPGGCAGYVERDGFTFDTGPNVITEPQALEELWALSGHHLSEDVELMTVHPFFRLNWPDGAIFDLSADEEAMRRDIRRISPSDLAGFDQFLQQADRAYEQVWPKLSRIPIMDIASMARAMPLALRHQAWRSAYASAARYVKHPHLREALSFHTLMAGGNPVEATCVHPLAHKRDTSRGLWWARGGTNRLVAGMVRHFERLGGIIRLHDPAVSIHTLGNRATDVETQSGWTGRFDAVASNADMVHTYRELLDHTPRGKSHARKLAGKRYSPGMFTVHFGMEGSWPGIPHHTVLFGPRYRRLMADIFEYGVLPQDFMIHLHHPTVTDPSVAPEGKSTFTAMVPVAHMGKLAIDWEQIGPLLEQRVLDEIGRRLINDIHDRIVTRFHCTPRDFALDLNAHLGSAFSLEPRLTQCGALRGHNRDNVLKNFYLVGAGTHPGAGIPAVVASAAITAGLMLEDLAR